MPGRDPGGWPYARLLAERRPLLRKADLPAPPLGTANFDPKRPFRAVRTAVVCDHLRPRVVGEDARSLSAVAVMLFSSSEGANMQRYDLTTNVCSILFLLAANPRDRQQHGRSGLPRNAVPTFETRRRRVPRTLRAQARQEFPLER